MPVVARNVRRTGRVTRSPRHSFQLQHMPFQIQPFMLAPVLPGETLKNLLIQSRAVTKPILNGFVGWWLEYYVFYIKHRDLDGRDDFSEMMLDLDKDMSAYVEAANVSYYHAAGGINWSKLCLKRVVEEYFRDEGEAWDGFTINSLPAAKINTDSVWMTAVLDDNFVATEDEPITVGVDDIVTASEIDAAMRTWQFQRANKLTEMDYEDWLATYGIAKKPEEHNRPELLRYLREWQYPSNTVEPTTGVPSSAVSWAIADRGDKDRFFREPGFIFGCTVARPKVYLKNQDGNVADFMMDALSWLPAIMRDDPFTSLKKFADTAGPAATVVTDANGYWIDIKDLFLYGDQFVNLATSTAGLNAVSLPAANMASQYPTETDVDGLFTGATDAVRVVTQDGVCQLSILGALDDTTPTLSAM